MYKRQANSMEAIIVDYIRHLAPCDYDDLGFSESYLRRASNNHDNRPLCIKRAKKLEAFRAKLGMPQDLTAWFNDNVKPESFKTDFHSLITAIADAKKEADDVSTETLKLLSDGDASLQDLKEIQTEAHEAYAQFRMLINTIDKAIEERT